MPPIDHHRSRDSSPSVTASGGSSANRFLQASTGDGHVCFNNETVGNCRSRLQNHQRSQQHSAVDHLSSIRDSFIEGDVSELKVNDLVGNGISGILYKWVNYGKGWRPRWFVLQDGVLSYYKIHGPDRIHLDKESQNRTIVIGEEFIRRMSQGSHHHQSHGNSAAPFTRGNPIGEVHLKVSTIRESRSDDKRFSIFSGTERLHLRAETQEDRRMWMEALNAVKDMFPRMLTSELMGPVDNFAVSTVMLRQRLEEEGINDIAIQDIEQIMRNEFSTLQKQVVALKQKQSLLLDKLRQLEEEA